MKSILIICLLIVAISAGVSARDVQRGETIYIGEPNLNIVPAIPENTIGLCMWNATGNVWLEGAQSCVGIEKPKTYNVFVDWNRGEWVFPVADYYALKKGHMVYNRESRELLPTDTPSTLTFVFRVRPASEMPIPVPTPTPTPTTDYDAKIAAMEEKIKEQATQIKEIANKTPKPTAVPTTEITPTSQLQEVLAPTPTDTVNYSATIAILEERVTAQEGWIDLILRFLGLK